MKKTSKKRLMLDREVVKALVVELRSDQLHHVEGGRSNDSDAQSCTCGPLGTSREASFARC
jgi:hypothetical protein